MQPADPRAGRGKHDRVGHERGLGQARQPVQAGADRDFRPLAGRDSEHAQPRPGVHAQIQREQHLVGAGQQRVGEPQRPPGGAVLRVPAGTDQRRQCSHEHRDQQRVAEQEAEHDQRRAHDRRPDQPAGRPVTVGQPQQDERARDRSGQREQILDRQPDAVHGPPPAGSPRRGSRRRRPALAGPADLARGGSRPPLAGRDPARDDAAGLDLGARLDLGLRHQHAVSSETGAVADPHFADHELIALDPPSLEVDVRLDRCLAADRHEAGDGRQREQARATPHAMTAQPRVSRRPRRALEPLEPPRCGQPLDQPDSKGQPAVAREAARREPPSSSLRDSASSIARPGMLANTNQPAISQPHPTWGPS